MELRVDEVEIEGMYGIHPRELRNAMNQSLSQLIDTHYLNSKLYSATNRFSGDEIGIEVEIDLDTSIAKIAEQISMAIIQQIMDPFY